ncbi:MAG: nucleotidyl transferase AbiEii/AbiGii toxin family protein [Candidatus Diapherotrites archaeon]|nr:nucleotidyl transferase AbiEii/AbiGii toxin family protein [Candidatus Diapherotrites archaeon]
MIPRDLVEKISNDLKITERDLIEKDLYLQGLLIELSKSGHFVENFAFKGGTCLTKAYFGYYRFSEDLDFTWIDQKQFDGKTQNQARKIVSQEINKLMQLFETAAKNLGLDFKPEKSNKRYAQFGGSNRFTTFKFWYVPTTNEKETFIKIQLNFIDKIIQKPKKHKLAAIAENQKQELELEYPEHAFLATESPEFYIYSLEEIAAEKIRAILTRRGFKARDIIDLYVLSTKGATIKLVKKMAIEKTEFMFKYLKYAENLKNKKFEEEFKIGEEQRLIVEQPGKDFEKFAKKTLKELNELAEEMRKKPGKKELS